VLARVRVRLTNSSLASQAVGPPTNRFEMSADGRPFPEVGRDLTLELSRRHRALARRLRGAIPLAGQLVHPEDSVLGPYSRWPRKGLTMDYETLIRRAFQPRWWASAKYIRVAPDGTTTVVNGPDNNPATDEYTLIEYNFSLFFGLAVQEYEATLVSDDTPFDRFLRDPVGAPLSPAAERGRQIFFNVNPDPAPRGGCRFCHSGALMSEASVEAVAAGGLVRASNGQSNDRGTRNIGVRETTEDLGNAGLDPFGASLSAAVLAPAPDTVPAADGTFKIPGLRNVELTAPYFHNGGEATLLDVVNFYARGGNQGGASNPITTRDGTVIDGLSVLNFNTGPNAATARADLVEFLKALTDERVRRASAPFDHPQLFVPNGHPGDERAVAQQSGQAVDSYLEIPATGRNGGRVLRGFLED
jgi:cytochrome c peroxidase